MCPQRMFLGSLTIATLADALFSWSSSSIPLVQQQLLIPIYVGNPLKVMYVCEIISKLNQKNLTSFSPLHKKAFVTFIAFLRSVI